MEVRVPAVGIAMRNLKGADRAHHVEQLAQFLVVAMLAHLLGSYAQLAHQLGQYIHATMPNGESNHFDAAARCNVRVYRLADLKLAPFGDFRGADRTGPDRRTRLKAGIMGLAAGS